MQKIMLHLQLFKLNIVLKKEFLIKKVVVAKSQLKVKIDKPMWYKVPQALKKKFTLKVLKKVAHRHHRIMRSMRTLLNHKMIKVLIAEIKEQLRKNNFPTSLILLYKNQSQKSTLWVLTEDQEDLLVERVQ
jgi:tagatose-1,6-bisphosphate aldolase non-catalytic subunit AgaZ/GatZ